MSSSSNSLRLVSDSVSTFCGSDSRVSVMSPRNHRPTDPDPASSANSASYATIATCSPFRTSASGEWGLPVPLRSVAERLPRFPTDILPDWLRRYVEALAVATQTPTDLSGMLALAVLSTVCAKTVEVEVRPGWVEPVNLYVLIALDSANRKSAVFRSMVQPLLDYEEQLQRDRAPLIRDLDANREILKARLRSLKLQAARVIGTERDALDDEVRAILRQLAELPEPRLPRLITDDVSPEALVQLLAANEGRMAVMSAEADIFGIMQGRYSHGAKNLEVFLKAHRGDPIRVDRILRNSDCINRPALTMGLTTQPAVVAELVQDRVLRDRGLLARFLYALPDSPVGSRQVAPPAVPADVPREYATAVSRLLDLTHRSGDGRRSSPQLLRLDDQANARIGALEVWLEPQLHEHGELGHMASWAGKHAGAVARVAGLLHMAQHVGHPSPWELPITAETVHRAVRLGTPYLLAHANAVFSEAAGDPTVEAAGYELRWIRRRGLDSFTQRDAFEGTKGRIRTSAALEKPLQLLSDLGYIRRRVSDAPRRPGRPPSPRYDVNPYLHDDMQAAADIWAQTSQDPAALTVLGVRNSDRANDSVEEGRGTASEVQGLVV